MGRTTLPEEIHRLRGREPQPRKVIPLTLLGGRPKCPRTLSKAAHKEWLAAVRLLEARGTLDPGAGDTLVLYATTKARWLECMADLDKNGLMVRSQRLTARGSCTKRRLKTPG
jgi:phage terminase small subunit